jgi:NADH-quinone oxidoreductase subunit I
MVLNPVFIAVMVLVPVIILAIVFRRSGPIFVGHFITLMAMFKKPVTVQYPEEPVSLPKKFRALHYLARYENGLERCVACGLCSRACPADAIYIEGAENNPAEPVSAKERYAKRYDIDMLRCIFCGYCEEACPEDAIFLGKEFEITSTTRVGTVYSKDMLLKDA